VQAARARQGHGRYLECGHALDITEGQPEGHCVRCCWIGVHIGREIGLDEHQHWELYYTLLLHDVGKPDAEECQTVRACGAGRP
jgi:HD-GYP domain-containing protein (c-di-GMP phosphodiesterase class II)